jgi:hypothetical protein
MSVTIAHYQKANIFLRTLAFVTFLILLNALTLYLPGGESVRHFLARRPLLFPIFISAWIGGLFVLWFAAVIIKRIVFESGRAIWIETGTLIYLHRWNFSVACRDIAEISSGTSERSGRPCIFLRSRDGARKVLLTGLLMEPDDVIIARIKENIPTANIANMVKSREQMTLREQM